LCRTTTPKIITLKIIAQKIIKAKIITIKPLRFGGGAVALIRVNCAHKKPALSPEPVSYLLI
jgi:hypothetical protein